MGKTHETPSKQKVADKKRAVLQRDLTEEEQLKLLRIQAEGFSTSSDEPSDVKASQSIQKLKDPQLQRKQLAALQRLSGNTLASRAVQDVQRESEENLIQRHDPGEPLLGGIASAPTPGGAATAPAPAPPVGAGGGAVTAPSPAGPVAPPGPAGPAGPAAAAPGPAGPAGPVAAPGPAGPAGPTAAPPGPAGPAGPAAAPGPAGPAGPVAAPGPAVGPAGPAGPAPAPTGARPARLAMPTLQTAYAQNAIRSAYGGIADRAIITGNIHIVNGYAALLAEYDRICIAGNVINPATGVTWVTGDALREDTATHSRTNAFASGNDIYIDSTQTDPTATVHEMLHVNTAAGFLALVGRAINEGITQRLAVQAVKATGQSVRGSERTYQSEQGVVNALVRVVGEGTIQQAYFNDPNRLVTGYEAVMGDDQFEVLNRTLDDTPAGYAAALKILQPPSVQQKIAAINVLLDWWVSDTDLDLIQSIVSTCGLGERLRILAAIWPRTSSLFSFRQRTRLRVILIRP